MRLLNPAFPPGYFNIQSALTGQFLTVSQPAVAGAPVTVQSRGVDPRDASQLWLYTEDYQIMNKATGLVLRDNRLLETGDSLVVLAPRRNTPQQQWTVDRYGHIINLLTTKSIGFDPTSRYSSRVFTAITGTSMSQVWRFLNIAVQIGGRRKKKRSKRKNKKPAPKPPAPKPAPPKPPAPTVVPSKPPTVVPPKPPTVVPPKPPTVVPSKPPTVAPAPATANPVTPNQKVYVLPLSSKSTLTSNIPLRRARNSLKPRNRNQPMRNQPMRNQPMRNQLLKPKATLNRPKQRIMKPKATLNRPKQRDINAVARLRYGQPEGIPTWDISNTARCSHRMVIRQLSNNRKPPNARINDRPGNYRTPRGQLNTFYPAGSDVQSRAGNLLIQMPFAPYANVSTIGTGTGRDLNRYARLPSDFPGSPPMTPAFDLLTGPAQQQVNSNGNPTQIPRSNDFSSANLSMRGGNGTPCLYGWQKGVMEGQPKGQPPLLAKTVLALRARASCGGYTPGNPRYEI